MIKGYEGSLYGSNRQLSFADVFKNVAEFVSDYADIGIPETIKVQSITTLYYLLYGRFGNSTIASSDINRFKYALFGIIWQYGPAWEKKLDVQKNIRELSESDLLTGNKTILNHADNPGTTPTTDTLEEVTYINNQDVSKMKRGKLEAYAQLYDLIEDDVTTYFLDKFKKLFLTIVEPELPLYYVEDEEES